MELRNGKKLPAWNPLSPDVREEADARTRHNQEVSPLLRLPAEIRNMIYAYVLRGHYIYLNEQHHTFKRILVRDVDGNQLPKDDLFALGCTCRQIHAESASLLFSLNEILGLFWSTAEYHRLKSFTPRQRDAIRNISVILCCFIHFSGRKIQNIRQFGRLRRITLLAGASPYNLYLQSDAAMIDSIKREVSELFDHEVEVVLKTVDDLYKGETISDPPSRSDQTT